MNMSVPQPPRPKKLEYKVISSTDLTDFNRRLQDFVDERWLPDGELVVTHSMASTTNYTAIYYSQRLRKETDL